MPRFSKPVVEDEHGELIMPGAYGAAPGGFCERRSTFEWDNNDRALINVDELSVELSDDDDEEEAAEAASSSDSTESSSTTAERSQVEALERASTRGTLGSTPTTEEEADEEMGISMPPSRQSSQHTALNTVASGSATSASVPESAAAASSSEDDEEEPTEHATPEELLDASVTQAPPLPTPRFPRLAKAFGCTSNHTPNTKRGKISKVVIFGGLVLALGLLVFWTQRQSATTKTGQNYHATSPNLNDGGLYDPPSQSLTYRGNLGVQEVLLNANTVSVDNLQPNWNSPYWEALYWILYEDPLQLTTADPQALEQRYLLTAFYFATSTPYHQRTTMEEEKQGRNQRWLWKHCAQPTTRPPMNMNGRGGGNNTNAAAARDMQCTHQVLTQERPSRLFSPVTDQWRWVSGVSECQWAGVECNSEGQVTAIVLADYGLMGSIPEEIGQLPQLERLSLPYNEHLLGSIPSILFRQVSKLELQYNHHNGTLVVLEQEGEDFMEAPLEILNLAGNELTGSLPEELSRMTNMRQISLQENEFIGLLPTGTQWPRLELLRAQQNRFTGTVPPTLATPNLRSLDVSRNAALTGAIPSQIGLSTKLITLALARAQFTGTIPVELYNCQKLTSLDVRDNQLEGTMATQIGQLTRLRYLFWQDNALEGTLPTELGALSKITEFHINGNDFEGAVPQEFCDLGVDGFPLANTAIVAADCTPETESEEAGVTTQCPEGCCSKCCSKATGQCTTNPLAILGLGTRTP